MDKKLEGEYRTWCKQNPMSDSKTTPGWSFEDWMDSMPKEFKQYFMMDVLNMFPHLKRTWRTDG